MGLLGSGGRKPSLKAPEKLQILQEIATKQEAIQTSTQGPFIENKRPHYIIKWKHS